MASSNLTMMHLCILLYMPLVLVGWMQWMPPCLLPPHNLDFVAISILKKGFSKSKIASFWPLILASLQLYCFCISWLLLTVDNTILLKILKVGLQFSVTALCSYSIDCLFSVIKVLQYQTWWVLIKNLFVLFWCSTMLHSWSTYLRYMHLLHC